MGLSKAQCRVHIGLSRCRLSVTSQAPGWLFGVFLAHFTTFKALFQWQLLNTLGITERAVLGELLGEL